MFHILLIFGVILLIAHFLTKQRYLLVAAATMPFLAFTIYCFSSDRKEWYQTGDFLMRITLWSRKHPVYLALIINAQYAAVFTIIWLFSERNVKVMALLIAFCVLMFLVTFVVVRHVVKSFEKSKD